jgi:hypothetical protein
MSAINSGLPLPRPGQNAGPSGTPPQAGGKSSAAKPPEKPKAEEGVPNGVSQMLFEVNELLGKKGASLPGFKESEGINPPGSSGPAGDPTGQTAASGTLGTA